MDKQTFLAQLCDRLSGLPEEDIQERLSFYSEMIDDRMEDGLTEEEAVAGIGSAEDVMAQVMSEIPLPRLVRDKVRPHRALRVWEILFLILGSPIWLSLLVAALAVLLSVYIVIWAVDVVLWVTDLSMACGSVGCMVTACIFLSQKNGWAALALFGAALAAAGLSILLFFGSRYVTRGILVLTKTILIRIKLSFVRKKVSS